jgi:hypothetical protein
MEVVYNMGIRRSWPVRIPKGECVLNAIAIAVLSFVYLNRPEFFKDNYRKAIDLLLKDC